MGHRFASVFALAHALACASLVFASVVGGTSTNDGGNSDRDSDRLLPMFTTAAQEVVDEIMVAPQPGSCVKLGLSLLSAISLELTLYSRVNVATSKEYRCIFRSRYW